ncbi:hypothetical protein ACLB2K_046876 [Fragaria x ananassa]
MREAEVRFWFWKTGGREIEELRFVCLKVGGGVWASAGSTHVQLWTKVYAHYCTFHGQLDDGGNDAPKWESQASAQLKGSKAHEVWPLLADFCNLDKWFPNLHTSYRVQGVSGQPGLVRYCEMKRDETTLWAKEKLLMIDPINQSITYEVGDNNLGLKSYVATVPVVPINNNNGCKIEWSYVCNPIEGSSLEEFNPSSSTVSKG